MGPKFPVVISNIMQELEKENVPITVKLEAISRLCFGTPQLPPTNAGMQHADTQDLEQMRAHMKDLQEEIVRLGGMMPAETRMPPQPPPSTVATRACGVGPSRGRRAATGRGMGKGKVGKGSRNLQPMFVHIEEIDASGGRR